MDERTKEVLAHCVEAFRSGASFRDVCAYMDKEGIDAETQKIVISELEVLDKDLELKRHKAEMRLRIKNGFKNILAGAGFILVGVILILASLEAIRAVFRIQIVLIIIGVALVFRGLLMVISGKVKMNEHY